MEGRPSSSFLDQLVRPTLGMISTPSLALHGADPGVEYATWLKSVVPTATLEIWPEHGHYPHLVDPQRFLDRVREFEARLELSAAVPRASIIS